MGNCVGGLGGWVIVWVGWVGPLRCGGWEEPLSWVDGKCMGGVDEALEVVGWVSECVV